MLRCFFFSHILAKHLRYLMQVSIISSKISAVHVSLPSPPAAQCLNNLDSLLSHMKSSFSCETEPIPGCIPSPTFWLSFSIIILKASTSKRHGSIQRGYESIYASYQGHCTLTSDICRRRELRDETITISPLSTEKMLRRPSHCGGCLKTRAPPRL